MSNVKIDKWPSQTYDCIFGDVNAHSPLWEDGLLSADKCGDHVEDWLANTGMLTLNDGSFTRINRATGQETTPDLSIVHSSLLGKFSWKMTEYLNSDHKPTIMIY